VRFVDIRFNGRIGAPPLVPVDAKAGFEVTVPVGLDDPKVLLELILPWEASQESDSAIREALRSELTDDENVLDADLFEATLGYLERYLPSEPPAGWQATMNPEVLDIEPADSIAAALDIVAAPGTGVALAVRATNADNVEQSAISDVVVVERGWDGTVALLYAED
jgi:hypothetical protein